MGRFLAVSMDITQRWSKAHNQTSKNSVPFRTIIAVPALDDYMMAFQWAQLNPSFLKIGEEYFIKSSSCTFRGSLKTIVKKYKSLLAKGNWRSFSEYEQCMMSIWKISNHNHSPD